MNVGETTGPTSDYITGSAKAMFLDENFGHIFAALSIGSIVTVLPTDAGVSAAIVGSVPDGIELAAGSLVTGFSETMLSQRKVRVFVGSSEGANDRWDSGEIRMGTKEIVYGGGDNLEPGEAYWLSVSVMDSSGKWSEPFTKCFVVPAM